MNASHLPTTDDSHDHSENVVARLQESQIFRDYQDAFQTATGLPLVLRAVGSFQPPLHGAKNIASFCELMGGENKTCSACLLLQARVEQETATEPKTLQCFAGLNE